MDQESSLTGTVERIVFQNEENGFSIVVLHITAKKSVIAKGYFPNLYPGERVECRGTWVFHKKFGNQFQVTTCSSKVPTSVIGLKKYLSSGLIKGIGPVYAEKLVNLFGEKTLEVIDKTPFRLKEVPGIGPKRIEQITFAWESQKEISSIMVFLQEKGVSTIVFSFNVSTSIYK